MGGGHPDRFQYKLQAAGLGDVGLDKLGVHPDLLPLDVVGPYLAAGSGPEGLPDKVRPVPRTVSGEPPAELVIGRFHRDVVVDVAEPQGRHAAQVETAVVEKLLVAPPVALLEHHHGQQYTQGRVGPPALVEKGREDRFVDPLGHLAQEHVVPGGGVVEYGGLAVGQMVGQVLEHVYLRGRVFLNIPEDTAFAPFCLNKNTVILSIRATFRSGLKIDSWKKKGTCNPHQMQNLCRIWRMIPSFSGLCCLIADFSRYRQL